MSKFADLVQWTKKNPPPRTYESKQKTERELAIALCDDLDAILYGELKDPGRFYDDFLYATGELIEVFVESVTKEE